MTATSSLVGRPSRSVWVGAIGIAGGARVDRHGVIAPDGCEWELDWAVGDAEGWRLASDEAAMRQSLVDSTPVVTTALRVPDGAVEQTSWVTVAGDGPVVAMELHNAAPVAVAVAIVVRPRQGRRIHAIDLDDGTVLIDGRPAVSFGRMPSRSVAGSWSSVRDAVVAGLAESSWPANGGRNDVGDLSAAFVFPLPHTATLRLSMSTVGSTVDVRALPGPDQVASGWRAQTGAVPRVDLPEGDAEPAFAATARHLLARAGDGRPVDADGERLSGLARCELAMALDDCGLHHASSGLLVAMIDEQDADGSFDADRLDATAAWLVAVDHHARLTGDDELVDRTIERIASAAHWLHRRHVGSRLVRSSRFFARGIGPDAAMDDDDRRARDARWAHRALEVSARMLRSVGQRNAAELVDRHAIELVHDMSKRSIVADGDGSGRPPVAPVDHLRSMLVEGAPCWTWPSTVDGDDPARAADFVRLVRSLLVDDSGEGIAMLPLPIEEWFGTPLAVHDLPTAFGRLSFALRWHGPRPALLWDLVPHPHLEGSVIRLAAPGIDDAWTTTDRRAEALLSEPPHVHRHDEGQSFS